ncbi:MAG: ATP-binding cassette domain-containing protein [Clostridiales bacterium]|nr:ATP-binding cassette domain-containing protein [Clostridiales bacterium]
MEEILTTQNLTKKYRAVTALDNVNMTVSRGDIYGFVGANGAGKTTLIRVICGLTIPTSGSFVLFGAPSGSSEIMAARRRTSAIVEAPAIYRNMTAKENLYMQCKILGADTSRVDEHLETVGLSKVAATSRKAGNFSQGMRQRLGIAMALCGNPEFMILDEPLNGLDPEGIFDMRNLILKLNRESGITFLISSHILSELSLVANKYGFIADGKLVKEITYDELHRQCRRSIDIDLHDPAAAGEYLAGQLGIRDYTHENGTLRIFDDVGIGRLVAALEEGGFPVLGIRSREESLEDYYLKVTGGRTDV